MPRNIKQQDKKKALTSLGEANVRAPECRLAFYQCLVFGKPKSGKTDLNSHP
ncbi:MAG: hypothetical protein ACI9YR_002910 [Bacteroidia bacterium]|jgi:hypothetical protein